MQEARRLGEPLRVRADLGDGLERDVLASAMRHCRTASTSSPTIRRRSSPLSASTVAVTVPSSEFSIGTSAASTSPARTAATVSRTVA